MVQRREESRIASEGWKVEERPEGRQPSGRRQKGSRKEVEDRQSGAMAERWGSRAGESRDLPKRWGC